MEHVKNGVLAHACAKVMLKWSWCQGIFASCYNNSFLLAGWKRTQEAPTLTKTTKHWPWMMMIWVPSWFSFVARLEACGNLLDWMSEGKSDDSKGNVVHLPCDVAVDQSGDRGFIGRQCLCIVIISWLARQLLRKAEGGWITMSWFQKLAASQSSAVCYYQMTLIPGEARLQ